jgi:inner membrane protein
MEPVTHVLTGWCLARSGPNRRARYATATMAIAAELPDIDTVWGWRGPVEGFTHHRGITHTFVGLPVEAVVLVGGVWLWHRWRSRRAGMQGRERPRYEREAPVRWGLLYGFALIGLLSHLLLDYTNNYGLRPFFPFDRHWYAGSIVFIFDPLIFVLLLLALLIPSLLGFIAEEVGEPRRRRGQGWAIAALVSIVAYWGVRTWEHAQAVAIVMQQSIDAPMAQMAVTSAAQQAAAAASGQTGDAPAALAPSDPAPVYLTPRRVLASPDPLSIFRWSTVADYGPVYQQAEVNTADVTYSANPELTAKPVQSAAVRAAEASPLGRAYIDWSPMPFVTAEPLPQPGAPDASVVLFEDPRFLGGYLAAHDRRALVGAVTVDAKGRVLEQALDGRVE